MNVCHEAVILPFTNNLFANVSTARRASDWKTEQIGLDSRDPAPYLFCRIHEYLTDSICRLRSEDKK